MTSSLRPLDENTVERLLAGRSVGDRAELQALGAFVSALSRLDDAPPAPQGHLVALLAAGFDPADPPAVTPDVPVWSAPAPARRGVLRHPVTRLAGLSLAAKVLLGSGVAVAGVTSAAGAGVLPGPVQDHVSSLVEAVTPFEVPRSDAAPDTAPPVRDEAPGDGPATGPRVPESAPPPGTPRPGVPASPAPPAQAPTTPLEAPPADAGEPSEPGRTTERPEQAKASPRATEPATGRAVPPGDRGVDAPARARSERVESAPQDEPTTEPTAPPEIVESAGSGRSPAEAGPSPEPAPGS